LVQANVLVLGCDARKWLLIVFFILRRTSATPYWVLNRSKLPAGLMTKCPADDPWRPGLTGRRPRAATAPAVGTTPLSPPPSPRKVPATQVPKQSNKERAAVKKESWCAEVAAMLPPDLCGSLGRSWQEAMASDPRCLSTQSLDYGMGFRSRSRIARECWRCCRLITPAPCPSRPAPRLSRHRLWKVDGDHGVVDSEACGEVFVALRHELLDGSSGPADSQQRRSTASGFTTASGFMPCDNTSTCSSKSAAAVELEEAETQVLAELRRRLHKEGGYRDLPNDLVHSVFRVCRRDPERAFRRALDMLSWREREGVDLILTNPAAVAEELSWRRLLRYGFPGKDRKSRPVMIQAVGQWDMRALNAAVKERKQGLLRSHVVVYETLRRQAQEALLLQVNAASRDSDGSCKEVNGRIILPPEMLRRRPLRWVIVLDVEGLSFWHTRFPEVLAGLQEASVLGSKYYPETVDRMFVVNASPGFHLTWRLISRFVKPNTRSKVRVLPAGDYQDLIAECGSACIPVHLGGLLPASALPFVVGK